MPQPEDEARVWNTQSSPHLRSANEALSDATQAALAVRFPELVTAQGTVDPLQALASVMDRLIEATARLEVLEGE